MYGIGATIHTGQEIQCVPYAGFFLKEKSQHDKWTLKSRMTSNSMSKGEKNKALG